MFLKEKEEKQIQSSILGVAQYYISSSPCCNIFFFLHKPLLWFHHLFHGLFVVHIMHNPNNIVRLSWEGFEDQMTVLFTTIDAST
jgi:hypothetical protein